MSKIMIYNIDADKKIQKAKASAKLNSSDSFMEVYTTKKSTSPLYVLTFRNVGKEIACDNYQIWGDIVIPNSHDLTSLTLINKRTGKTIENVSRVQFGLGKCAITYLDSNGKEIKRFIEKDGTLSKGELGAGGFEQVKDEKGEDKVVFKDMFGSVCDKMFETFDGKVLAGEIGRDDYLHFADSNSDVADPKRLRAVCYDDFGRKIDSTSAFERGGAQLLHNFIKNPETHIVTATGVLDRRKYLLDDQFYNSLLIILQDIANKSIQKIKEAYKDDSFSSTYAEQQEKIREVEEKLRKTIEKLQELRREAVKEYTSSLLTEA